MRTKYLPMAASTRIQRTVITFMINPFIKLVGFELFRDPVLKAHKAGRSSKRIRAMVFGDHEQFWVEQPVQLAQGGLGGIQRGKPGGDQGPRWFGPQRYDQSSCDIGRLVP